LNRVDGRQRSRLDTDPIDPRRLAMIRTRVLAAALFALLAAAALPAAAQSPDWPENNFLYNCSYTLGNGAQGTAVVKFTNLPAQSIVFPDGNQLKRGRLVQYIPGISNPQTTLDDRADLAYKPAELPSPPYGTRFELTLPDDGIQCKNFVNFFDFNLHFSQCSNGTVMNCSRCGYPFPACL
jgi:hypothetical protein